jgi:hypothetical protein
MAVQRVKKRSGPGQGVDHTIDPELALLTGAT